MSTAPRLIHLPAAPLYGGDRMNQAEFHERYEAYPDDVKIELIGGIVYMASPLRRAHGRWHLQLGALLERYSKATPGVEALDNATTILSEESEPQPDLALRILSDYGGQSRETKDDYVEGPPEMVAEVAHSTRAIDLHQKRLDYQRAGVREYLVLSIEGPELIWFAFSSRGRIAPDADGVCRSRVSRAVDRNQSLAGPRQGTTKRSSGPGTFVAGSRRLRPPT